jgi:glutamate transport system substrate-binding protein
MTHRHRTSRACQFAKSGGKEMKISKTLLAIAACAGLALSTAACGGGGDAGGNPGEGGKVTIGIKFDQPGLGLKEGNNYTGFDVEVARYVAKDLGYTDVTFTEAPSAQRETLLQSDQVKMIFATYSITDDRKQKVSFGGPYFIAGQDLLVKADNADITGPDALNGKKLCSVAGSTSAKKIKDNFASAVQLQEYDTYSKCVEALNSGSIDAVTTDNVILAGFAAQPQYQGKLKVVGKPFSEERYGVGIKKGDTDLCTKINTSIDKMIQDGSWQKALDSTVGPSGFKPDATKNPPKPEACS